MKGATERIAAVLMRRRCHLGMCGGAPHGGRQRCAARHCDRGSRRLAISTRIDADRSAVDVHVIEHWAEQRHGKPGGVHDGRRSARRSAAADRSALCLRGRAEFQAPNPPPTALTAAPHAGRPASAVTRPATRSTSWPHGHPSQCGPCSRVRPHRWWNGRCGQSGCGAPQAALRQLTSCIWLSGPASFQWSRALQRHSSQERVGTSRNPPTSRIESVFNLYTASSP